MKKRQYPAAQIVGILREAEAGGNAVGIRRKHGVSASTFQAWKAKHGGMDVSDAKRLKEFEQENARLERPLAEPALDNAALKELLGGKW